MSESKDSRQKSSGSWRDLAAKDGLISQPMRKSAGPGRSSRGVLKKVWTYRIGAYVRLSPSDEIRGEGSLVSHPQRLKEFVRMKCSSEPSWGFIEKWYTDPDYSAKDMNRPAFIEMCRDIKDGKINAVLATELSRLNRNTKDFLQFLDFLKRYNVKLIVLKENFDTSTPAGEMMLIQMSAFAQFERESIVARIKDGARARAERGVGNGGAQPLGYDNDPEHRCHLIVNETEMPYVELIFRKYLDLGNISALQEFLNKGGYRTKLLKSKSEKARGGKKWCHSTLYRLLTNLAYIGKKEINKSNRSKPQDELRQEEQYKIVNAQWPAIISEDLFSEVQARLVDNRSQARVYKHRYRLRQLVTCGLCNEALIGMSSTGRGGQYFYYGHMRKRRAEGDRHLKRCVVETVPAINLEEAVIARLSMLAQDRDLIKSLAKEAAERASDNADMDAALIRS
jgi:site-specific DNA recombinase